MNIVVLSNRIIKCDVFPTVKLQHAHLFCVSDQKYNVDAMLIVVAFSKFVYVANAEAPGVS